MDTNSYAGIYEVLRAYVSPVRGVFCSQSVRTNFGTLIKLVISQRNQMFKISCRSIVEFWFARCLKIAGFHRNDVVWSKEVPFGGYV
jgi:hypothetical protein